MNNNNLTISNKIKLYTELHEELSGYGLNGDTDLAHINKYEKAVLLAMGGVGTRNPVTNLLQFFGSDEPKQETPQSTQTVRNVSDLPEYAKPFVERLFSAAEDTYNTPYEAFTGDRLAPISQAQDTAFKGLEQFLTAPDPTTGERKFVMPAADELATAKGLAATGASQFGEMAPGDFQQKYMSPYQQAVTDIQKREFQKEATRKSQELASQAVKAGAFGGSRAALSEALQSEVTQRGLSDIQAAGSQAAYNQGLTQFAADRDVANRGAAQYASLGSQEQGLGLSGLGALQTTGEAQRQMAQQPLDLQYEEFARQQEYPKSQLGGLSAIYRGNTLGPSTYQTAQKFQQAPSVGQNLLAAGSIAAGISTAFGKPILGQSGGGLIALAEGGPAKSLMELQEEEDDSPFNFTNRMYKQGVTDPVAIENEYQKYLKGKAPKPVAPKPVPKPVAPEPKPPNPAHDKFRRENLKPELTGLVQPFTQDDDQAYQTGSNIAPNIPSGNSRTEEAKIQQALAAEKAAEKARKQALNEFDINNEAAKEEDLLRRRQDDPDSFRSYDPRKPPGAVDQKEAVDQKGKGLLEYLGTNQSNMTDALKYLKAAGVFMTPGQSTGEAMTKGFGSLIEDIGAERKGDRETELSNYYKSMGEYNQSRAKTAGNESILEGAKVYLESLNVQLRGLNSARDAILANGIPSPDELAKVEKQIEIMNRNIGGFRRRYGFNAAGDAIDVIVTPK